MEPGEEFEIDREELNLLNESVEVVCDEADSEQADPPVEAQSKLESPAKTDAPKRRGRKKQE